MPKIIQKAPEIAYDLKELRSLFPDTYRKVYEKFREEQYSDPDCFWLEEMIASYKKLAEALNLRIADYELAVGYGHTYIKFTDLECDNFHDLSLEGLRAYKYFINRIDFVSRNVWHPISKAIFDPKMPDYITRRKHSWGKPWTRRDCPLTGVCYDEDLIDHVADRLLKHGDTMEDAMKSAWEKLRDMAEKEQEYYASEENFLEADDHYRNEHGRILE